MQDPSHDKTSPSAAGAAQDGAMPPQAASAQAAPPAAIRTAAAAKAIETRILVPFPKVDNQPPVTSTTG